VIAQLQLINIIITIIIIIILYIYKVKFPLKEATKAQRGVEV
jgi:hypothetical protein